MNISLINPDPLTSAIIDNDINAFIDIINKVGKKKLKQINPWKIAIESYAYDIVKHCLNDARIMENTLYNRPLEAAIENYDEAIFKECIEYVKRENTVKNNESPTLEKAATRLLGNIFFEVANIAIIKGNLDAVKILHAENLNVRSRNDMLLGTACKYGHNEIIDYLVEHGCAINFNKNYSQHSPLYLACDHNRLSTYHHLRDKYNLTLNKLDVGLLFYSRVVNFHLEMADVLYKDYKEEISHSSMSEIIVKLALDNQIKRDPDYNIKANEALHFIMNLYPHKKENNFIAFPSSLHSAPLEQRLDALMNKMPIDASYLVESIKTLLENKSSYDNTRLPEYQCLLSSLLDTYKWPLKKIEKAFGEKLKDCPELKDWLEKYHFMMQLNQELPVNDVRVSKNKI